MNIETDTAFIAELRARTGALPGRAGCGAGRSQRPARGGGGGAGICRSLRSFTGMDDGGSG